MDSSSFRNYKITAIGAAGGDNTAALDSGHHNLKVEK